MNMRSEIIFQAVFALAVFFLYANAALRFSNVICTIADKNFGVFEYCYIKAHNRSFQYLSLKVKVLALPITNVSVGWALLKRANGYKPFLYNYTIDACAFLRRKTNNPVYAYFYNWFGPYSNMNHTCPYNHDIMVDKLGTTYLNDKTTNILPIPRGEYCINSDWYINGLKSVNVKVFLELA